VHVDEDRVDGRCRFALVLVGPGVAPRWLIAETNDADEATALFHTHLGDLRAARRAGELVILERGTGERAIVRQVLDA
jgi:hypothetical protein